MMEKPRDDAATRRVEESSSRHIDRDSLLRCIEGLNRGTRTEVRSLSDFFRGHIERTSFNAFSTLPPRASPSRAMYHSQLASLERLLVRGNVVVLSGAGMSTSAGIPDFRSQGSGTHDHIDGQILLHSMHAFARSRPSFGHMAVSALMRHGYVDGIITSNHDSLHELAGTPSHNIIHLFGGARGEPVVKYGERCDPSLIRIGAKWCSQANLVLVLGSSMVVSPMCDLPLLGDAPPKMVLITRSATPMDHLAQFTISADIDDALRRLCASMNIEVHHEAQTDWRNTVPQTFYDTKHTSTMDDGYDGDDDWDDEWDDDWDDELGREVK